MDRPLLVSDPLIRPISQGRKTETRRLNGLDWVNELPDAWEFVSQENGVFKFQESDRFQVLSNVGTTLHIPSRYGVPGDTLWVRENWYVGRGYNGLKPVEIPQRDYVKRGYMGDGPRPEWAGKVRPSIHMPRWLCRYRLKVEKVTVERLHDITNDAAKREGVNPDNFGLVIPPTKYREAFRLTWIKLNGQESWDLNPWVWVVFFKLLISKK